MTTGPVTTICIDASRALRGVLWGGLLLTLTAGPVRASEAAGRAVFRGGGSLNVERVEYDRDWAVLHLAGGGQIAVPGERLLRVELLSNSQAPRTDAPAAPPRPLATPASAASSPPPASSPSLPPASPVAPGATGGELRSLIGEASWREQLHPDLVAAMVKVESNFNPTAVSARGALGLLQLMPVTAQALGVRNPFDPRQNLDGGVRYFRTLLDHFGGDIVLALAAYNAGEEAVRRYGGLPPFAETRAYVSRVLTHFEKGF